MVDSKYDNGKTTIIKRRNKRPEETVHRPRLVVRLDWTGAMSVNVKTAILLTALTFQLVIL